MDHFNTLKNLFDNYVINKFHKLSALFISLFIVFWLLLSVHLIIRSDFNYEWYLYGFIFVSIILSWFFFKYKWPYPRNEKDPENGNDKTGLVVSIFSENYEGTKMKNKFIGELERQINDSDLHKYFNVIVIPNHYAEKIKKGEDIEKIHEKVDGHIYFYGDVKKENDGKDVKKYFLNLDGHVKHLPILIPTSNELAFDFRAVLPKEICFSEFFELRGCRATAKIIYLTTKYVVGTASFLSGNPFFAFEMHKNLAEELNEYKKIDNDKNIKGLTVFDFKQLGKIKNKLPLIISSEALIISRIYQINNVEDKAREFLDLSLKNNPNNYESFLLKAIFDFQFDNDPVTSLKSIEKAKRFANNRYEWRYSWAFLKFWSENYQDAYRMCKKISTQHYDLEPFTLNEVEEFNLNILKNVNKQQLYFWIGYLNYKKKNNSQKALEYFENFIKIADKNKMSFLIKKAETFLSEIKKTIEI